MDSTKSSRTCRGSSFTLDGKLHRFIQALPDTVNRVDYSDGHRVCQREDPPTLYVGASHINHLKTHVGGTTWSLLEGHLKGDGLNDNQTYLGDQWSQLLDSGFKPKFIVILCGSNDTDKFQNSMEQNAKKWPKSIYWKYVDKKTKAAYKRITKKIDEVLLFLHTAFPEARLLYSKILPRCWWCNHTRTLARWLDHYIVSKLHRTYKVKEIWAKDVFKSHYQFMGCVEFGMLETDMIHLNQYGNRALISAIMKVPLHLWKFTPTTME